MQINLVELDLATLKELGGGVAFDKIRRLLERCVEDMQKRPGDERARKVNITMHLTPVSRTVPINERVTETILDSVKLKLAMNAVIPNSETAEYDLGLTDAGALVFNPHSPHNHRQAPLPFDIEGEAREIVPMAGSA